MTEPNHCSYLLRLWRECADAPWRVVLIPTSEPDTHRHFETLEQCFEFVETTIHTTKEREINV